MKRNFSCRPTVWYLLLSAFQCLVLQPVNANCIRLVEESYSELRGVLDDAQNSGLGFVVLCPFEISGEGCPDPETDGYRIWTFYMDFFCAFWHGGARDGCIIDCPMYKNHFVIGAGSLVSMDNLVLRGARESAIHIESFAFFKAMACTFEYNGYEPDENDRSLAIPGSSVSSGGAAVRIDEYALADLEMCNFFFNRGKRGGAIWNEGEAQIAGGNFHDNQGEQGGAVQNLGALSVNQALFRRNHALCSSDNSLSAGYGGAIYSLNDSILVGCTFEHNSACNSGGGMYAHGTSTMRYTLWRFNSASVEGPAVAGEGIIHLMNRGCGNELTPGESGIGNGGMVHVPPGRSNEARGSGKGPVKFDCDGVVGPGKSCSAFSSFCSLPTAMPSSSPTSFPSSSSYPSSSNFPSQSNVPSMAPSVSISPTTLPSTSGEPSFSPSYQPSSSRPSTTPSLSPSSFPTKAPSMSPSMRPSSIPSSSYEPSSSSEPSFSARREGLRQ